MKFDMFGRSCRMRDMSPREWGLVINDEKEYVLALRLTDNKLPNGETGQFVVIFEKSNDDKFWFFARVIDHQNAHFALPVWILPDECELQVEYNRVRQAQYLSNDRQAALTVTGDGSLFCQVPFLGWLNLKTAKFENDRIGPSDILAEFPSWFIRIPDGEILYQARVSGEVWYKPDTR